MEASSEKVVREASGNEEKLGEVPSRRRVAKVPRWGTARRKADQSLGWGGAEAGGQQVCRGAGGPRSQPHTGQTWLRTEAGLGFSPAFDGKVGEQGSGE